MGYGGVRLRNQGIGRMQRRDLGVLDGPVLLFGGPYSNLHATEAVLSVARERGATAICTGDVVAYCACPAETVAAIRASGCAVVAGNCEIQLATGAADCGCGFDEGSACDLLSAGWFSFANAQIKADDRRWMAGLPDILTFSHHGARYAVLHGGATDVARFIWSTCDPDVFAQEWAAVEAAVGPVDHIIAGHSGIPFQRAVGPGTWTNAGVIGMPPHDGASQTVYAMLDGGHVTFDRLSYDVSAAVQAMQEAGLTQGYHTALQTGYWPSEDVLPPDLRVASLASG